MSSEETINELLNLATGLPIIPSTPTGQAIKSAIRHIKAWDKVREDIQNRILTDNESNLFCRVHNEICNEILEIIDNRLQEVTNCE